MQGIQAMVVQPVYDPVLSDNDGPVLDHWKATLQRHGGEIVERRFRQTAPILRIAEENGIGTVGLFGGSLCTAK